MDFKDAKVKINFFEQRDNMLWISRVTYCRSPILAYRVIA
jgi:hypothetical protein